MQCFSCSRSKRNAEAVEAEGAARLRGVLGGGPVGRAERRLAGLPGRRPGVAIPWQISMTLQAMKSIHDPVVVGLARIVHEQPATGLAGMDLAEICTDKYARNMQRISSEYAGICKKYAQNMQIYRLY